jgi:hypothetical protein
MLLHLLRARPYGCLAGPCAPGKTEKPQPTRRRRFFNDKRVNTLPEKEAAREVSFSENFMKAAAQSRAKM